MPKLQTTLLGTSDPACDGQREWRFVVNGASRAYYSVRAVNRQAAEEMLRDEIATADQQLGEGGGAGLVAISLLGAVGFGIYKLVAWWQSKQTDKAE